MKKLIIILSTVLLTCSNVEISHVVVDKIETTKSNFYKNKFKYTVTFKNGCRLYTNYKYKVNDTLR